MTTCTATAATFDIHVMTQDHENYGDAAKPYWKAKGGVTVVLTGFTHPMSDGIGAAAAAVVERHRASIEVDNDMFESRIIDWELVPAGSPTHDERMQQEYDGRVSHPSERKAA